jgi:hypothetical protein
MKRIIGWAVIVTATGPAIVAVREGETAGAVAALYRGDLVDECVNRWLAEQLLRECLTCGCPE